MRTRSYILSWKLQQRAKNLMIWMTKYRPTAEQMCHKRSPWVPSSIATGGNFFLLNLFCSSLRKPLLPTFPESSILEKTGLQDQKELRKIELNSDTKYSDAVRVFNLVNRQTKKCYTFRSCIIDQCPQSQHTLIEKSRTLPCRFKMQIPSPSADAVVKWSVNWLPFYQ